MTFMCQTKQNSEQTWSQAQVKKKTKENTAVHTF